ncbi:MAG TPA: YicC/YloC family endoribonuclease [Gemmatimonadales bacterium]|nr:YicC/YloC family endoribonuclease [Gemmatimonadales bacterium]
MTGFGAAEGTVAEGRLRVEIRTVNHRYFNPQLKLPYDLNGLESDLRDRLRRLLERGHVAVTARWLEQPATAGGVTLDLDRARAVVRALRQLKKSLRLKGEPDLAFVARHPDVLAATSDGTAARWADVQPIVERAAADVLAMREREGRALAADLLVRVDALEAGARTIEQRAPERLAAELARLRKSVAELASGVHVDEQRLALEIALLADRVDISEELVRFRTHLAAVRAALGEGDGAVGKQLGFLAQELLREVNTMGSKANDAAITQAVIAMKGELERFREQLENLE